MKILVISDTHGFLGKYRIVAEREKPIDMLIHLGDVGTEEERLRDVLDPTCPVALVKGNCDFCSDWVSTRDFTLGKHKIHMEHGNDLSMSLQSIAYKAEEIGADIMMFGHTHKPLLTQVGNVTILNPGSISIPRQDDLKPTYMVIEMDEDGEMTFIPKQV